MADSLVMDANPTVEKFIYDYFWERKAAFKLESEINQVFRRRFYDAGCYWCSERGLAREAEKIVDISPSDTGVAVVTKGGAVDRLRYRLKSFGESWLIHEVHIGSGVVAERGRRGDACQGPRTQRATNDQQASRRAIGRPTSRTIHRTVHDRALSRADHGRKNEDGAPCGLSQAFLQPRMRLGNGSGKCAFE